MRMVQGPNSHKTKQNEVKRSRQIRVTLQDFWEQVKFKSGATK